MTKAGDGAPERGTRVLAAAGDAATLQTIERAISANGDRLFAVMDMAEAIAIAASENPDVAFVDVTLDGGSGLALVHHLTAVCPGIAVYAMAPEGNLELGSQAVALGAAGFLSLPPQGDALLHAVGEVREKHASAKAKAKLEDDLASARRRAELMDRVVRLAHGGAQSEVARAIVEALAELSDARGGALYATFDPPSQCVRLAVTGTTPEVETSIAGDELVRDAKARGAMIVPLAVAERILAIAILEKGDPAREKDVTAMATLASTVLAFVDAGEARAQGQMKDGRSRVYTFAYLQDIAGREIDKARRHGRRLAIAAIILDPEAPPKARAELEEVVLSVVRDTDVLAKYDDHEFYLLLPETGSLGAHACRRRLLIRAEGDRRSRTTQSDRRGPVASRPSRGVPISIGVAAYPHDGIALDRLIRASRQRAQDASKSAVHTLGLASMQLAEIIDTLLARPLFGGGIGSPYPLDLGTPAAMSLVSIACREAKRGGAASVLVTMHPGMGLMSAARQAFQYEAPDVLVHVADVRSAAACEDAEAIVVSAEHGTWVCCGRIGNDRFKGVHAADPLLADLVSQRLAQAAGIRLP